MKKQLFKNVISLLVITFLLGSCSNNLSEHSQFSVNVPKTVKSEIAKNISEMKNNGLFDSFIKKAEERSAENKLSEEDLQLLRFINETDDVLYEISKEENGDKELKIIECLFCESTVGDVMNAFYDLSEDMGDAYRDKINSLNQKKAFDLEAESSRNVFADTNSIKLCYYLNNDIESRKAYAPDFDKSTRYWYSGFCAASIAGCIAASYGGFWTRIVGIAAATAGLGSMAAQLGIWCYCSDLGNLVSALKDQDAYTCNKILQSDLGKVYGDIILETSLTLTACYATPAGRAFVYLVIGKINAFISVILKILPAGIDYAIGGVPIKLIVL